MTLYQMPRRARVAGLRKLERFPLDVGPRAGDALVAVRVVFVLRVGIVVRGGDEFRGLRGGREDAKIIDYVPRRFLVEENEAGKMGATFLKFSMRFTCLSKAVI